ncbi:MAG: adenylyl-sulfate kinase [Magnetococcales bacterium]|nr:adenylyl-sulfate kinase [Magnetococcales bacterium]
MNGANNQNSGVIWVTGYSASGKTTVGRKLEMKLRSAGLQTVFLDGDDLRSIFGNRWGYDRENRIELSKVYFRFSSHLAAQGLTVIIAAVSMYDEVRVWLKENVPNSIEVYLEVPEYERIKRDKSTKNIYRLNKDLTTMYDESKEPDIVIQNFGKMDPDTAAEEIKQYFQKKGLGRRANRGRNQHWDAFYDSEVAPIDSSLFAISVARTLPENCDLLEVGCGNGRDANYFDTLGHNVTAIDASDSAIKFCQKRYGNQSITFHSGTIGTLSAADSKKYSAIYSRFCIHAMTPIEENEFLNTATKLLLPKGKMYLECRSINDPLARKGEVISPTERISGHYRRFIVLDELVHSLERANLRVIEAIESKGLAIYKDEDPMVIRITAQLD